MFKKMIFLSFTFLGISTLFAAQTTLNFQNPKPSVEPGAPIPPSDFANQVKTTNTQKHAQFKQELDQQKSVLSHPKIPSLSQVQSMSQTPPPAMPTTDSSTNNPLTNTKTPSNKPAASSNTILTPENVPESIPPTPPPAANGGSTLPGKPPQSQPYTGFPQSQPSNTTEPKNTGGFNIQY